MECVVAVSLQWLLGRRELDLRLLTPGLTGPATDIAGAMGEDIDSLFISGGLAAAETKTADQPDPDSLTAYLASENIAPTYTIGRLR